MPINFTDFSRAPLVDNGLGDLIGKAIEGFKAQRMPGMMNRQQQAEEQKIKAQLMQNKLQEKFGERGMAADIGLKEAQAQKEKQFGGLGMLSGSAREAMGLEILKTIKGEDSPVYQNAKRSFDQKMAAQDQLMQYRDSLISTADKRASSPYAKKAQEEYEVSLGYVPGSGMTIPLTPERQKELQGQYELNRFKEVTDPKTRERIGYATNLHKTIDAIDRNALTMFSGITGTANLSLEKAKDLAGATSPEYRKYKEAVVGGKIASKQLRQFLQDSVQPGVQEALKDILLPSKWDTSPETAAAELDAALRILDTEIDTLYSMGENADVYKKPKKNDLQSAIKDTGLNIKSEALTKENIMATAKEKNWDEKKTQWVLKKAGF